MSRRRDASERAALRSQLPVVAAGLARSVRSGATLTQAVEESASALSLPAAEDLQRVQDRLVAGWSVHASLEEWARHRDLRELDLLVAASQMGHAWGGDVAAALEGAAVSLTDRVEVADEARALATQARTSALVLCALPPFGALCMAVLDPSVATTLFTTPRGWACMVLGASLDAAGVRVMSTLVAGALR